MSRSTPLTLVTTLRPGRIWLRRLIFWLATYLPLPRWTLLRLKLIHYAGWTIRSNRQLLFESNFNGTADSYVEAFSYVFPGGMRAIWGNSRGFPGPQPVETLEAWIRLGALEPAHYYCAYPEASTKEVLAALEVSERVDEFRSRVEGMSPEAFSREYGKLVAELQWSL